MPAGEEELVKPLAEAGAGDGVRRSGGGEEAAEVAGAEGTAAEADVVDGDAEYSDEDEENVFTGSGAIGARARGEGRESDGVDVAGGAEDEEGGVGAVEEEEAVAEGTEDSVGDGL